MFFFGNQNRTDQSPPVSQLFGKGTCIIFQAVMRCKRCVHVFQNIDSDSKASTRSLCQQKQRCLIGLFALSNTPNDIWKMDEMEVQAS